MPLHERILAAGPEIAGWRRHLHARPELLYDVDETAAFVADKLASFGCDEVAVGIGRTGVVGLVKGQGGDSQRMIALRADMDALPITEETGLPHASTRVGTMHACGHDGHMAMLLGAARELCRSRAFDGSVALIFQPAEEGGAGALAMIEDGLFERFPATQVFGMHNMPGLPVGSFASRPGPIMASADEFTIRIAGRGAHAAMPHQGRDPVLAGAAVVQALQQVAARNADPLASLVLSVTTFHAGLAHNVIPDEAVLGGTVRCLTHQSRELVEKRMAEIIHGIAAAHGVSATVDHSRGYPVTVNDAPSVDFCLDVAGTIGEAPADRAMAPLMVAEDFAYMLEEKPGAFVFLGNGDSAPLHNAAYDFDDRALVYGASYWVKLTEQALAAR